jgi:hypothetical protein
MILAFQFKQVPGFRRENIREAKNHNRRPFGEHAASLTETNKISTLDNGGLYSRENQIAD